MKIKQISITAAVFAASSLSQMLVADASAVAPSLLNQMERQNSINIQNQKDAISRHNDEQLRIIRERNAARLASQKTGVSTPIATPNVSLPKEEVAPLFSPTAFANQIKPTIKVASYVAVAEPKITQINTLSSDKIDMNRLGAAWLSWNNGLRAELGLVPYAIDSRLNGTAQDWANFSRDRGYITHGRPGDGCIGETNYACYNFQAIDKWFQDRGVNPTIINRAKHTENLGIGSFQCNAADCTDAAIAALKKTYDFFYSEKSYDGVHYRSLVSPVFTKIGIGFAEKNGTYYAVVHYVTDL